MGKWLALLNAKMGVPAMAGTAKTDRSPLLSVMAVTPKGDARDIQTPAMTPEACDLAAVAWTDGDIDRFQDRRARLLRWAWPEADAEALAERLARRDREADDRVTCAGDCTHYRPGRCGNHRKAGLYSPDLGHDLAALLQRCAGSSVRGTTKPSDDTPPLFTPVDPT